MLGDREPEIYGSDSLSDIENSLKVLAKDNNVTISFMQSNAEHEIINKIQEAKKDLVKFILINPGPLTHTSIALRDTFLSTSIPFIEIHISNIFEREDFRKKSYLSDISSGIIAGFGANGYKHAFMQAVDIIKR
jgi:3-dehydroquinate dehydratase-2